MLKYRRGRLLCSSTEIFTFYKHSEQEHWYMGQILDAGLKSSVANKELI